MSTATDDLDYDESDDFAQGEAKQSVVIIANPLFWAGLATAGSAFRSFRFELAGMAFHPYMVTLFFLLPRAIPRLQYFPAARAAGQQHFFLSSTSSLSSRERDLLFSS